MALSKPWDRPKLAAILSESLALTAAVAEVSGEHVVDVTAPVTPDGESAVTKTFFRVKFSYVQTGTKLRLVPTVYAFTGDEIDYASGGTVPPIADATQVDEIDLDVFYLNVGDTRKNS